MTVATLWGFVDSGNQYYCLFRQSFRKSKEIIKQQGNDVFESIDELNCRARVELLLWNIVRASRRRRQKKMTVSEQQQQPQQISM